MPITRHRTWWCGSLFCLYMHAIGGTAQARSVLYVDDDAPRGGEGASWTTAFNDLQDALDVAADAKGGVAEIRVAQGLYVPSLLTDPLDPRSATFQLLNGVALTGGYAGFGAPDPNAHSPQEYQSILSGDLNGDDDPAGTFVNNAENVYHVVDGSGANATAALSGFVITAGNANIDAEPPVMTHLGGGLLCVGGSPTLTDLVFTHNTAGYGGALHCREGSNLTIANCSFIANIATEQGGAVRSRFNNSLHMTGCTLINNDAGTGAGLAGADLINLVLEDCILESNVADVAGAARIYGVDAISVTNCVFGHNSSLYGAGAIICETSIAIQNCEFLNNESWFGGALLTSGSASIVNSVFSGNSADDGGGVFVAGACTMINCSVFGNHGAGIRLSNTGSASLTAKNCIFWGNLPAQIDEFDGKQPGFPLPGAPATVSYCSIQGGWSGAGNNNIDADPMLLQPGCDNLRLAAGSPCLDAGDNSALPQGITTDLDGQPRIMNGTVAMGAYESPFQPLPPAACEDNLDNGEQVNLAPVGVFGLMVNPSAAFINYTGPDDAYVVVTQIDDPGHDAAGGFTELGCILQFETSLIDGEILARISVPLDDAVLNGFAPFDVDLTFFQEQTGDWALAVAANTQNSPGHAGSVGDRILVEGSDPLAAVNWQLGDYGVFWNPELHEGFVWANVDHASEFAFGVQLPQCSGDCAFPIDGLVNHLDVAAVVNYWGSTPPGPPSFADITSDGVIQMDDLLAVINSWGPCP